MADDLSDDSREILNLKRDVRRLQAARPLENASVTNGRLRFIGGTLRVDSGGRAEIVGTLQVDGSTIVTGTFRLEGAWTFTGNGTITGNVTIAGKLTQNGPWEFVGAGKITGNVDVTGTIRVLAGGKIQVGNIVIDPTISGGAIAFANGAQVFTDGSTIQVYKGNGVAQISDTEAKLQLGGTSLRLTSGHILASGMATRSVTLHPGAFVGAVVNVGNELYRLV